MLPFCILAIENESDREFMTWLYLEHERLMYSTIKKITDDQWLLEDAMQIAVEKLIGKVELLRTLDRTRLINYIITTCKNTAYTEGARAAKQRLVFNFDDCVDQPVHGDGGGSPEVQVLERERYIRLAEVWDQLSERSRYMLEARYILDKSFEEIAEDLNIKPGSVRMALTRARKDAAELYRD